MNPINKKLIIIGARPESLINFRGELIKRLASQFNVVAMASSRNPVVITKLESNSNITFKEIPIKRNGLNPLADIKTWFFLRNYFHKYRPDIILAYTIKPIIWGGLASRALPNTKFFALITGLGYAFQGDSFKRKILTAIIINLYRLALGRAELVIFQNTDNLQVFVRNRIIKKEKCALINGSGVDTKHFSFTPISNERSTVIFLCIARLLKEKGLREYAQAASIVKKVYPNAIFQLLGNEDSSPDHIPISKIREWQDRNQIEYLGSTDDVRPYLKKCHIYVLPSYHEGMPRSVLEAMSIGRPILTTDVPGCRDTVCSGDNGLLAPKANSEKLAEQMIWFIENPDKWEKMGSRSREIAVDKYDVDKINSHLEKLMGL